MNGSSFLSYVKQQFKREDKDTEIYTATADTIMDMRSRFMSDEHMTISNALSGISAQGDYILTPPSDFGHLIGDILVRDTDADDPYTPMNKLTKEEYDRIWFRNQASTVGNRDLGVPVDYAYFGEKFYIGPAVEDANFEFKINYTTEDKPTIVAGTDPVPFTDQFREVLRHGVLMRMYMEQENYGESDRQEIKYERGIQKIIENDEMKTNQSDEGIVYHGV